MNSQLIGNETGLVGYWQFNEGTGNTTADLSGNGNNGTLIGASWTEGFFGNSVLAFSQPEFTVREDGTPSVAVTVIRTGGLNESVTATVNLTNDTTTTDDYSQSSVEVNFAPGEESKIVTIPLVDDFVIEGNETVDLSLTNPIGNATIGEQSTATLTITDNDFDWYDPNAWDSGVVPADGSNVTLNYPGEKVKVTFSQGNPSLNAFSLYAIDQSVLSPELTAYTTVYNADFEATGVGSVLDLSTLTTLAGATYGNNRLYVHANDGGQVNLSGVNDITGGGTIVVAEGDNSIIDLSSLTSFTHTWSYTGSYLQALNGGVIHTGNLTELSGVSLYLNNTGTMDTNQIVNYSSGAIDVDGMAADLSGLQSFIASSLTLTSGGTADVSQLNTIEQSAFYVRDGVTLELPSATSYSTVYNADFEATGAGSVLDLSALTTLAGATYGNNRLYVHANDGGQVNLSGVNDITGGGTIVVAEGDNSIIDLSSLTSFTHTWSYTGSYLQALNGGVIHTGNLTDLSGVSLYLNNTGTIDTNHIANYSSGAINVDGMAADLSGLQSFIASSLTLTNGGTADVSQLNTIDQSAFYVRDGVTLDLPTANSYSTVYNADFEATGAGSVLDLSALTTLAGATYGNNRLYVHANDGGQVNLSGVNDITGGGTIVVAEGDNSIIDLSSLTSFTHTWSYTGSYLQALNGGSLILDNLTTLQGVDTLTASSGGHIDLSDVTTLNSNNTQIIADGTGSIIDLSNLTDFSGLTFTTLNGGTILIRPVANDDEYTLDEDTILNIAANGLLANDINPANDSLTTEFVTATTHGTVNLLEDGSFTYTPDANFAGTDSFTYRVTGAETLSSTATVTLTVNNIDNDAPTDIQLSQTNIDENSPNGSLVGDLTIFDPDPDDSHTLTLVDDAGGRFTLVNQQLQVADGSLLDAETNASHTITIEATDAQGLSLQKDFTITVNDINEAPTAIDISSTTVPENSPNGTIISILTAIDPDVGDSYTFSLVDDADGRFAIDDDKLVVADGSSLDFETQTSHSITVRAQDAGGLTYDRTLEISLSNIVEPGILSFNSPNYLVNPEGIAEAEITIIRTEGTEGEVQVTVNATNGTAIAPEDYDNTPVIVTFIDGEATQTIFIAIEDDALYEADENFTVTLSEPQGGASLGTQQTATVTIINDDFPNLQVSSVTPPVEGWSGQPVEISWTVLNNSTIPTQGTWLDRIYLSDDNQLGNDILLSELSSPIDLAARESFQRSHVFTLPQGISGDYQILVVTDSQNSLSESNESDNATFSSIIPIYLSPYPDLQVSSITVPSTAQAGQQATFDWTVTNIGTGATNVLAWYDQLYLSLDTTLSGDDLYLGARKNPTYLPTDESYLQSLTVTLPDSLRGQYYAIVKTDATNLQEELTFENNNTSASVFPLSLEAPPPPGFLHVADVSVSPATGTIWSGQAVTVSWTMENIGDSPLTDFWDHAIALSSNPSWDGNRNQILAWHQGAYSGGLDVGETHSFQTTITLPSTQAGDFYVVIVPDPPFWTNYDRDFGATTIEITLPPQPDLQVTQVIADDTGNAGKSVNIAWTVSNEGFGPTGKSQWNDVVYLSSDPVLDPSDRKLKTFTHYGRLESVTDYTQNVSVTLPNNIEGDYYLLVKTDDSNIVFEHDDNYDAEGNNINYDPIPITVNLPSFDLEVASVEALSNAFSGQYLNLRWTVTNQGTDDLSLNQWSDRIILSMDDSLETISDNLTLSTINQNRELTTGKSYQQDYTVQLPVGLSGNYHLFVTTDSQNQVYESNAENNNSTSVVLPITLSLQPDLEVSDVSATVAWSGQNVTVNWTVTNTGAANTRSRETTWIDALYLSSDGVLDGSDRLLTLVRHNGILNGGSAYNATANVTLPIGIAGDYTLFVISDRENVVYEEGGEDNNQTAIALPISLTPPPDLQVTQVVAPSTAHASQPITIDWTVANLGQGIIQGDRWYDAVYLSKDQFLDREADLYLGFVEHSGEMAVNDSYTASLTQTLPQGISGPYYAFVVTDSRNQLFEGGQDNNNTHLDTTAVVVTIPPPEDLQISNITVPVSGISGESLATPISWTVTNQGNAPAVGTWYDAVYLSADDSWEIGDALIATVQHTGNIASQGSYTASSNAVIPGAIPGDYQMIVRSDIRNQVGVLNFSPP